MHVTKGKSQVRPLFFYVREINKLNLKNKRVTCENDGYICVG